MGVVQEGGAGGSGAGGEGLVGVVQEGGAGGSGTGGRGWWEWCRREGCDQWQPHSPLVLPLACFRPPLYPALTLKMAAGSGLVIRLILPHKPQPPTSLSPILFSLYMVSILPVTLVYLVNIACLYSLL